MLKETEKTIGFAVIVLIIGGNSIEGDRPPWGSLLGYAYVQPL